MEKKRILHRKTRNRFNKFVGLFLIFSVTLVCLISIFLIVKNQQKALINPLSITFSSINPRKIQNPSDEIKTLLQKNNFDTASVTIASDSSILATLKSGQIIDFSQNKNPTEQIASLQLIRARLTIEGKRFNRIDFRFDNPVVTF